MQVFRRSLAELSRRGLSTRTAASLLEDSAITQVLSEHKVSVTDALEDSSTLVAVLSAFRTLCNKPVPSDAFLQMHSASDIADYYEKALAPNNVQPHAKRVFENRVSDDGVSPLAVVEATPEAVAVRATEGLPSNLQLDPKTFAARPIGVMSTGKRLDNVPFKTIKQAREARRVKRLLRTKTEKEERERARRVRFGEHDY